MSDAKRAEHLVRMHFECEVCGAHPKDGTPTFRVNEKGVPAVMRCRLHLESPPPKDVDDIVRTLGMKEADRE